MSCISCASWKFNGEHSQNGLLDGFCSEKQMETAHNETCEKWEEKAALAAAEKQNEPT